MTPDLAKLYPINTTAVLKVEVGPVIVYEGEANVYRQPLRIGRRGQRLDSIWIFHGRDTGDLAEHDTEIYDGQVPLALRSDHDIVRFDGWQQYQTNRTILTGLNGYLLARSGTNPKLGRTFIRPHWGIVFVWGT